jgi:hypothetical protein
MEPTKEQIEFLERTVASGMAGCRMCSGIQKALTLHAGLDSAPLTNDELDEIDRVIRAKEDVPNARTRDLAIIALMQSVHAAGKLDVTAAEDPRDKQIAFFKARLHEANQIVDAKVTEINALAGDLSAAQHRVSELQSQVAELEAKLASNAAAIEHAASPEPLAHIEEVPAVDAPKVDAHADTEVMKPTEVTKP